MTAEASLNMQKRDELFLCGVKQGKGSAHAALIGRGLLGP